MKNIFLQCMPFHHGGGRGLNKPADYEYIRNGLFLGMLTTLESHLKGYICHKFTMLILSLFIIFFSDMCTKLMQNYVFQDEIKIKQP